MMARIAERRCVSRPIPLIKSLHSLISPFNGLGLRLEIERMSKICLMMVAGERSGDLYGAELAAEVSRQLGPVEIFGCGGDAMRQAGVQTTVDSREFALVGISEVVPGLRRAYRAFQALLA